MTLSSLSLATLCAIWLSVLLLSGQAGSTVVLASSTKSSQGDQNRAGTKADRFVEASPLTVAAVCRDGIAILATHAAAAHDPLLLENMSASHRPDEEGEAPRDLPRSSRGPFRIGALDAAGSVLVSAGWRTDCAALASQCRSLAASEMSRYGDGSHGTMEYGRYLAEGASTWMAHCAFSDNVRHYADILYCRPFLFINVN
jgi:hypothetical protein